MKKLAFYGLSIMAGLLFCGIAQATTTYDPTCMTTASNSSGACGFVGKGDVQIPWGWNNATLQGQAGSVTFSEIQEADYVVTCEWDTGTNHVVHHVITHPVFDTVAYDLTNARRSNPQGMVTGFFLTGKGAEVGTGDPVPAVGDECPGNSSLGLVTSVVPDESSVSDTLFASDLNLACGCAIPDKLRTCTSTCGPTPVWANGVSVQP